MSILRPANYPYRDVALVMVRIARILDRRIQTLILAEAIDAQLTPLIAQTAPTLLPARRVGTHRS